MNTNCETALVVCVAADLLREQSTDRLQIPQRPFHCLELTEESGTLRFDERVLAVEEAHRERGDGRPEHARHRREAEEQEGDDREQRHEVEPVAPGQLPRRQRVGNDRRGELRAQHVELDGYEYHRGRAAFERDHAKHARLRLAGYEVLALTHLQLTGEEEWVIGAVRSLLDRAVSTANL